MSLFRSCSAITIVLLSGLLTGCINGNYLDATEPDAAKLRFVANAPNTLLDYFDDTHCDGQTTGTLNNIFTRDSARRVDMSFAPPDDADGYLELKLKPEQDTYLRLNTYAGYSVCGSGLNFTPERNAEYELTLNINRGQCITSLKRVKSVNGQEVRTPLPIEDKGLPACAGRSPLFPKLYADTPHRVALIDQIIQKRALVSTTPDNALAKRLDTSPQKLDTLIAERKAKLGFTLPDDYWALYRKNLETFEKDALGNETLVLTRYKNEYHRRLQQLDDQQLELWATPEDKSSQATNSAALLQSKAMALYYFQAQKVVLATSISNHLDRMAQMDAQYDVCKRYPQCWKLN